MKTKLKTLIALFLFSSIANAQSINVVARDYLKLYTTKQFQKMEELFYTESSVFEDPTMSFFSADKSHPISKGKKEIVDFLEKGFAKISSMNYKIENSFTAGSIAYNYGVLHYDYEVEKQDGTIKIVKFKLPLTIILKIKGGKVIHHQDIADYNVWLKQYNKQIK